MRMFSTVDEFVDFKIKHNELPSQEEEKLSQRFKPENVHLTCPLHDNIKFKFFDNAS